MNSAVIVEESIAFLQVASSGEAADWKGTSPFTPSSGTVSGRGTTN